MTKPVDLKTWMPGNGDTGVIVSIEFEPEKGSCGRMATALQKLSFVEQSNLHLNGCRMDADLNRLYYLVYYSVIKEENTIVCLQYALQRAYPEVFGEERPHDKEFDEEYGGDFRFLERVTDIETAAPGYHKYACSEPLILESEDWDVAEWKTLCKFCGVNSRRSNRVQLNVSTIEAFFS